MDACRSFCLKAGLAVACFGSGVLASVPPSQKQAPQVIRRAVLDAALPVFIPVHSRVATTVRFPRAIGEPMGTSFVDSDELSKASSGGKPVQCPCEYVISFTQGDPFFSVRPLANAEVMNLNIPYEGETIVLYFYPVENPLEAVASLVFIEASAGSPESSSGHRAELPEISGPQPTKKDEIVRSLEEPHSGLTDATPARIEGLLSKMKLVHAARVGTELDDLGAAMGLEVALSNAEEGTNVTIPRPVNDCGLFQLILLRAVRDPRIDAVGFIVLMRNTSARELVFDTRTFSARAGVGFYTAQAIDAPTTLIAGETKAAYFVIIGSGDGRPGWLKPGNDWRISVQLTSPSVAAGSSVMGKAPGAKGGNP